MGTTGRACLKHPLHHLGNAGGVDPTLSQLPGAGTVGDGIGVGDRAGGVAECAGTVPAGKGVGWGMGKGKVVGSAVGTRVAVVGDMVGAGAAAEAEGTGAGVAWVSHADIRNISVKSVKASDDCQRDTIRILPASV